MPPLLVSYVVLLWYVFYSIILVIFRYRAINSTVALPTASYDMKNTGATAMFKIHCACEITYQQASGIVRVARARTYTNGVFSAFPAIVTPQSGTLLNILAAPP